tara:strand:+ start:9498 stop:9656 length:159 start_codon:yes stop_codon:yes gene_type:complete
LAILLALLAFATGCSDGTAKPVADVSEIESYIDDNPDAANPPPVDSGPMEDE